jgi:hypothetical protein
MNSSHHTKINRLIKKLSLKISWKFNNFFEFKNIAKKKLYSYWMKKTIWMWARNAKWKSELDPTRSGKKFKLQQ